MHEVLGLSLVFNFLELRTQNMPYRVTQNHVFNICVASDQTESSKGRDGNWDVI